jgi:hypothetical protein
VNPEPAYLTSLAQAYVCGTEPPAAPPGINWLRLCDLMAAHGVLNTFMPADSAAPPSLRHDLAAARSRFRKRTAFLLLELSRLLPALEDAGSEPVVLKGAALAETVYAAPEDRFFADLDVLVTKDRREAAGKALENRGYRPAKTQRHPSYYDRFHFHHIFFNGAGICVELHWDLATPQSYWQFDVDRLYRRTQGATLGTTPMRILAPRDQLLHVAAQSIGEGFLDLRHILDAALLYPRIGDPGALAAEAHAMHLAPGVWCLLSLCRDLAGLEISREVLTALHPSRFVGRCLASLDLPALCVTRETSDLSRYRYLIAWLCSPSFAVAARAIRRFLFPGNGELLGLGFQPGERPGLARRARLTLGRLRSLARLLIYQSAHLAHINR